MAKIRLSCLDCRSLLVKDEQAGLDIWNCAACGKMFLRVGPRWVTELDTITPPEHEFAVVEFLRKAA